MSELFLSFATKADGVRMNFDVDRLVVEGVVIAVVSVIIIVVVVVVVVSVVMSFVVVVLVVAVVVVEGVDVDVKGVL